MGNEIRKRRKVTFTPEELGLERITVNGKRYIDVTPLWIDSKKSQEVQKIIQEKMSYEEFMRGGMSD